MKGASLLARVARRGRLMSGACLTWFFRHRPIVPRKIMFVTSTDEYSCNPKWICEELIRRQCGCDLVWCTSQARMDDRKHFPVAVRLVRRDSIAYFRELASARVVIDNSVSSVYSGWKKRKGQFFIETWHGAIGLKRFSRRFISDRRWIRSADRIGSFADCCLSNSVLEESLYREDYWKNVPVFRCGHPRNDILFELDSSRSRSIKDRLRACFGLPPGYRCCLYAPTYRESSDLQPPDLKRLSAVLRARFGGDWLILVRWHFLSLRWHREAPLPQDVVDVSSWPDVQELMLLADIGITDVSSWICEYLFTGRPGFLFIPDADSYLCHERGLCYPLEKLPYPMARNDDELQRRIMNFDASELSGRIKAFCAEFGAVDDGRASMRVVDMILEQLDKDV